MGCPAPTPQVFVMYEACLSSNLYYSSTTRTPTLWSPKRGSEVLLFNINLIFYKYNPLIRGKNLKKNFILR